MPTDHASEWLTAPVTSHLETEKVDHQQECPLFVVSMNVAVIGNQNGAQMVLPACGTSDEDVSS